MFALILVVMIISIAIAALTKRRDTQSPLATWPLLGDTPYLASKQ